MDFSYTLIFWCYVFLVSTATIYASATKTPGSVPKPIMVVYNVVNSLANLYIVFGIFPYVCNESVGYHVKDDENLRHLVYLHYMLKYVDFFDTFTMILRHKWKQVHLLQLFHHSTIGLVWYWVYADIPAINATYAFGAFANSCIHFVMYLHYFVTCIGYRNPFKAYLTGLQMLQFLACLVHAVGIGYMTYEKMPEYAIFPIVQAGYMSSMLGLFYVYVYRANAAAARRKKEQDKAPVENKKATKEIKIKIDGITYNASEFAKKHPGGNIIEKYDVSIVADASDAYHNFHTGSVTAKKMLAVIPRIETEEHKPTDFQNMVQSWKNRGLYGGGMLEFVVWASSVTAIVFGGYYLLMLKQPILGGIVIGFAWGQCGFIQHHAGHLAFSGNAKVDFVVQGIFESLFKGGSGRWWRNRHNKHHAMPNSIEHDGDLRTTPFFAWDEVLIKKVPTFLLRIQHMLFLPMLAIYVPVLATSVFAFVIRRKHWDELGLIVLHFVLAAQFSTDLGDLAKFYFIGYALQGIYLGGMFGLNHFALPRVETHDAKDWAEWQYVTTCNWGVGSKVAEYVSGFLNLQIEHHVASRMPPENYHLIIDDLREYARKHNIPYHEMSFFQAFKQMISGLYNTGQAEYALRMSGAAGKKSD